MVVVGLVILIPLVASVYSVEVLWLSGTILIMPPINLQQK